MLPTVSLRVGRSQLFSIAALVAVCDLHVGLRKCFSACISRLAGVVYDFFGPTDASKVSDASVGW